MIVLLAKIGFSSKPSQYTKLSRSKSLPATQVKKEKFKNVTLNVHGRNLMCASFHV